MIVGILVNRVAYVVYVQGSLEMMDNRCIFTPYYKDLNE